LPPGRETIDVGRATASPLPPTRLDKILDFTSHVPAGHEGVDGARSRSGKPVELPWLGGKGGARP